MHLLEVEPIAGTPFRLFYIAINGAMADVRNRFAMLVEKIGNPKMVTFLTWAGSMPPAGTSMELPPEIGNFDLGQALAWKLSAHTVRFMEIKYELVSLGTIRLISVQDIENVLLKRRIEAQEARKLAADARLARFLPQAARGRQALRSRLRGAFFCCFCCTRFARVRFCFARWCSRVYIRL